MSWTDDDYRRAVAWRSADPPLRYAEIAARLGGGRSGEAVRQKLISERLAAARGGSSSRTAWREAAIAGPRLGERVFLRRLLAGGGHSRFSEVGRNLGTSYAYHALVLPLIGPDGLARPCARAGCQCVASAKAKGGRRACGMAVETDNQHEGEAP